MNKLFLKKTHFIYYFRKIKGINYIFAKKIYGYLGFSFYKYKYNYRKYYNKNITFFINYILKIISFIKRKFILLKTKLNLILINYKNIGHYKGKRLIFFLPLNGQRTHTNSRTIKKLLNVKTNKKIKYEKKKHIQKVLSK
jgi:ribosomal protein S13